MYSVGCLHPVGIDQANWITQAIIVLANRIVFLGHRILLQEHYPFGIVEPCTEIGIIDLLESQMLFFLTREGVAIIRCRHVGLRPLLAEGIVVLAVEIFAACRRYLRHDALSNIPLLYSKNLYSEVARYYRTYVNLIPSDK